RRRATFACCDYLSQSCAQTLDLVVLVNQERAQGFDLVGGFLHRIFITAARRRGGCFAQPFNDVALAGHTGFLETYVGGLLARTPSELLPMLANRSAQTVAQWIAVNGVVTAPGAISKFHSREPHLTKKLDAEPLATRDLDQLSAWPAYGPPA